MADADKKKPVHFPDIQTLTIPFQAPRRGPCTATITCKPNDDPLGTGQDLLDIYDDPLVTTGFPVLKAVISSPTSSIYASIYGLIQLTKAPSESWEMDIYPPFKELNSPFAMWGAEPTFVDCPSRDVRDPKWEGYDWTARAFLTYDPKAAMEKVALPIFCVEWGFDILDGKVLVKQLKHLDVGVWNEHLDLFREKYQGWTFGDAKASS